MSRLSACSGQILLVLVLMTAVQCGYSSDPLYDRAAGTTIAVPMFENRTKWRELETDLTRNVVEKVTSQTPYRIADLQNADLVLRGEITDFSRPVLSEDPLDTVVRSSVRYEVKIQLLDGAQGDTVRSEKRSFSASFAGTRQETPTSARREAEEKIGDWTVRLLERQTWSLRETDSTRSRSSRRE